MAILDADRKASDRGWTYGDHSRWGPVLSIPGVGVMVLRTFFATIWAMAISGILLASCQIARSRARARIETNMFDRNGVHAPVGRRGGVTRSAVELKYSKLRVGAASSTRVRLVDVFIKLLSGGFFVAGIGLHWLTFSMSVRIVARPDGVLSRPIGLAVSLLNRRLPFEQPSFLIGPMLEVRKNSFI